MARRPANPLPDSFDPLEIALDAERGDISAGSPARAVLVKQAALLDADLHHRKLQIAEARVGVVLRLLLGLAGVVAALAIGLLVWSAANERGLVVQSFSVPPDLAAKGVTGQVVAARLLDKLSEMQKATDSMRSASTYANNWNGDIKVEIPETGISVGELRRLLVEWLGHQTAITGELFRVPGQDGRDGGLILTARDGTEAARLIPGTEAELDAMIQQAAEHIYQDTQPYRYAVYLWRKGDPDSIAKARVAMEQLIEKGDRVDRLWAYAGLNLIMQGQGDFAGAMRVSDAGIALEPRFGLAYANRSGAESGLGHDEAALSDSRMASRAFRSDGGRFMSPAALALMTPQSDASVAAGVGDFTAASRLLALSQTREANPFLSYQRTVYLTLGHDLPAACDLWRPLRPVLTARPDTLWVVTAADAAVAYGAEDWPAVVSILSARAAAALDPASRLDPGERAMDLTHSIPLLAVAKARLGDAAGAEALIGRTPLDCYACVIARGDIATARRDWAGADRWYAQAVRQGPSLPFAHGAWAQSFLARGDLPAALVQAREAARLGPRWADAPALWGEALAAQGDAKGAEAKFRLADRLAPRWGRNHLLWGEALARLGRPAEARAQWLTARGLDLSVSDRSRLDQRVSGG